MEIFVHFINISDDGDRDKFIVDCNDIIFVSGNDSFLNGVIIGNDGDIGFIDIIGCVKDVVDFLVDGDIGISCFFEVFFFGIYCTIHFLNIIDWLINFIVVHFR